MIATSAPTPGTVISRRQTASARTMRQHRAGAGAWYSVRNASRARSIGSIDPLQHRLAGDQLADPRREPALAHLADLQPEAAQNAPDAQLDVQQLALQQLAPDQQRPDLLGWRRLAVHRPEPAHPQQLGDAARVLAVGLDHHRRQRRLHVPGLQQHRLKPGRRQAGMQPLRQRPGLQPDPGHRSAEPAEEPRPAPPARSPPSPRARSCPVASTTHTLLCSNDTSIPAKCSMAVPR